MVGIFSAVAQRVRAIDSTKPMRSIKERYEQSKESKQQALVKTSTKDDIIKQITETTKKMRAVQSCFDLETNFDMIDVYIMELSSLEKRYDYLIKEAKRKNITA